MTTTQQQLRKTLLLKEDATDEDVLRVVTHLVRRYTWLDVMADKIVSIKSLAYRLRRDKKAREHATPDNMADAIDGILQRHSARNRDD